MTYRRHDRCFRALAAAAALLVTALAATESNAGETEGFQSIFNGRDLTGWVVEGTQERKEEGETKPVWSVHDGLIRCDGEGFGYLRYEKELCDFVWRLEYRMAKGCNSGLGIRTVKFNGEKRTRPSYASFEVQLRDDAGRKPDKRSSGSLYSHVAPSVNAVKPAPEWNAIEVRCQGPRIRVSVNNQLVLDVDQSTIPSIKDKPLCGFICMQNHGDDIEFRNLELKELDSAEPEDGFRNLFNGRDLAGWVPEGEIEYTDGDETKPAWTIHDGVVHCSGNCFGFLRYDRKLDDFVWRLEYRLQKGGNSGLGIRGTYYTGADETRPSFAGYEIQLVDDAGQKPNRHSTGSLYRYIAPKENAGKPAPEWNRVEIRCQGPHIRVTLNGKVIQDVDQSEIDQLKDKPLSGYISLQTHTLPIEFRNVRLKEL